MATTLTSTTRHSRGVPHWQAGIVAIILAALAGAALYGIARAAGTLPHSVLVPTPGGEEPITLVPVLMASAQAALAATLVHALLRRLTARPNRNLWRIGGSVLALSILPVFAIEDAPATMIVTLIAMHLAVGLAILGTLSSLALPRDSS